jgi:NitT/TauT family transport system permease protein
LDGTMRDTNPFAGLGTPTAGTADTPPVSTLGDGQGPSTARQSAVPLPHVSRIWIIDVLLFCLAGAVLYAMLVVGPAALHRPTPSVTIDLRPTALPNYTLLSLLRMVGAYVLSLIFTVVVGYAAAHNRRAERVLIPMLDILQSIPVLSFLPAVLLAMIALFPGRAIGLEIGAILLIFTGMVWNMAFSFYHSLLTIPPDLTEAARVFRLSPWRRLTSLELPASVIGLVWNSMLSWAGGWFFLMACESFTLVNRSFTLPGLGSYLAVAASKGDIGSIAWGLGTLIALIVVLDQFIWRPMIVWSQRFKIELNEDPAPPHSWFLDALRRSRALPVAERAVSGPLTAAAGRGSQAIERAIRALPPMRVAPQVTVACWVLLAAAAVAIALAGSVALIGMMARLGAHEWKQVILGAGETSARVAVSLLITIVWTVPAGIYIGLRPQVARIAQPLAQIAASVPATAVFPVMLLLLLRVGGGLSVASILLMLMGTQWYVLFNVIGGATSIPQDLIESTEVLKVRGWMLWRTLWLPAVFPYLVTGGITAQGGAWNASIVSEYVTFSNQTLQILGLGSLIAAASQNGNYPLLAASTVTMAAIVVVLNRLGWRRAMRAAEERYHL